MFGKVSVARLFALIMVSSLLMSALPVHAGRMADATRAVTAEVIDLAQKVKESGLYGVARAIGIAVNVGRIVDSGHETFFLDDFALTATTIALYRSLKNGDKVIKEDSIASGMTGELTVDPVQSGPLRTVARVIYGAGRMVGILKNGVELAIIMHGVVIKGRKVMFMNAKMKSICNISKILSSAVSCLVLIKSLKNGDNEPVRAVKETKVAVHTA